MDFDMKKTVNQVAGYRLLDRTEDLKEGDVCGWSKKTKVDMKNWAGAKAGAYNQPVFRPMKSFVDL